MGHRLSKIYTRTGDDGTTGLANGERVAKHDARIAAVGDVDETNSVLGLLLAETDLPSELRAILERVQSELFEIGAGFALPGYRKIGAADVERLEIELDALNAALPPLKEFVLPGGNRAAALCHLARAVCRRAERSAWAAAQIADLDRNAMRYLNRLSDLLFVGARVLARRTRADEPLWRR